MRYRMIERCRDTYAVRMMCRCLDVSTSGYYDWRDRAPSARALDNERLLDQIRQIHIDSDGVLGAPRIHDELRDMGERCSLNRIARLMAKDGIRGIPQKKSWANKASGQRPDDVANHLARQFDATEPNTKWVTDITYLRTAEH